VSVKRTRTVGAQRLRVIDLNNKGTPIRRIAELLGVDPRTVRRILREAGRDKGSPGRPPTIPYSHVPRLWAAYLDKKTTVREIADEYGTSVHSVRRAFHTYRKNDAARFLGSLLDGESADGAEQGDAVCDEFDSEE